MSKENSSPSPDPPSSLTATTSLEKTIRDEPSMPSYQQQRLERDARKHWDIFYKRNTTHFFKDRHWISREYTELQPSGQVQAKHDKWRREKRDGEEKEVGMGEGASPCGKESVLKYICMHVY